MTMTHEPIVTGVDGSGEALDAVRWAGRTARQHDVPLEIVHALDFSALLAGGVVPPPEEMKDVLRAHGRRFLRAAREIAEAQGAPAVTTRLDPDRAAQALIEASRKASLVVVGSGGRGRLTGLLAGSVASAVGAHACSDVVVVRGDSWDEPGAEDRPVVAGIDGSEPSGRILATAVAEAKARRTRLVVVHASADDPPRPEAEPHLDPKAVTEAGTRLLTGLTGEHDDGGVRIERVVVRGHPRRELIERSATAQLVVLGDRGRGGFPGMLLGSTGQALLHNAVCPVYLVRTAT
ncbi:nucleotide-binding universal stress UspA family protein [Amycolatopsis lexingtonensis]|uniref:Nucleotide-binding universal stress UspA family protein n=1 Tax=Amycolatopsis lexingtonensis TaxID=218822 RepID=A0ABR9HXU0_9PSEU|nr:universal stress protein [Amycolatopsis lexingtonensis]MBE1495725.1 nucleotide-binding universal stress UspA family protein [Amycolatopsis lexingtonensis]